MADELFSDAAYAEYLKRKAKRTKWPDWTETDGHGFPIFPCDRIFQQDIPTTAPIAPRRKRIKQHGRD
jgi:hypothetical protein